METPVEPLVDFTDAVAEVETETNALNETEEQAMMEELQGESEDLDELPNTLRGASIQKMNARVDSQRHLSVPFGDVGVCEIALPDANQPVDEASELEYYDDLTPEDKPVVESVITQEQEPICAIPVPIKPEPETPASTPKFMQDAPGAQVAKVDEFLYYKIVDNQCSSHTKEIHKYAHLSEYQQRQFLPSLFTKLSKRFENEATERGLQETSVDVQSSLCLLEQMFLTLGRLSPLQDMYTAEEEEMLDQLARGNSSNNV